MQVRLKALMRWWDWNSKYIVLFHTSLSTMHTLQDIPIQTPEEENLLFAIPGPTANFT